MGSSASLPSELGHFLTVLRCRSRTCLSSTHQTFPNELKTYTRNMRYGNARNLITHSCISPVPSLHLLSSTATIECSEPYTAGFLAVQLLTSQPQYSSVTGCEPSFMART